MKTESIPIRHAEAGPILISLSVNSLAVNFILDTGASQSIIATHLLESMQSEIIADQEEVVGASREPFTISYVSDVEIKMGGWQTTLDRMAFLDLDHINVLLEEVDGLRADGVLGIDLLVLLGAKIDLAEMKMEISY